MRIWKIVITFLHRITRLLFRSWCRLLSPFPSKTILIHLFSIVSISVISTNFHNSNAYLYLNALIVEICFVLYILRNPFPMNISVRIFSVKLISKSPLAPVVIDIFFISRRMLIKNMVTLCLYKLFHAFIIPSTRWKIMTSFLCLSMWWENMFLIFIFHEIDELYVCKLV